MQMYFTINFMMNKLIIREDDADAPSPRKTFILLTLALLSK